MKRGIELLDPYAGLPEAQESNSQGSVRDVGVASKEPNESFSDCHGRKGIQKYVLPDPDSFSAGAEMTTEFPALVRAS